MDNERALKIELRQALDDVLPPAPWLESAVREDLRLRRSSRSRRRVQAKPWTVWPRGGMQFAAAMLIVVLAAAALAAVLDLRYRDTHVAPAAMDVTAYQAMVSRDLDRLRSAGNGVDCVTLQSTCPAQGTPVLNAYKTLSDDLNGTEPPARFAVIDAQLRRHVGAAMADLNAVFAAYAAQDQAGLDRANYLLSAQGASVGTMSRSIVQSREGSILAYVESLRTANQNLALCTGCQPLERTGSVDCDAIQTAVCEADIVYAASDVESVEAAVVTVTAPSSFAAQDALLQRDLARADSGLLAMANAQVTGDQAGFNYGRQLLEQALSMVNADIAGILGS
jgi:hypothetical protein